ncbi:MAG: sigma-54-dependent Fis family transcriptional regulator, partial [Desulfobacteraceae bacterium]|nr:sigma-54-dependent Fis family transcriptional regulator [Desulfobacteraceae bacterium]
GNVRELENVIERAILLTEDLILQPDDLYIQSRLRRKDDFKEDDSEFSLKEAKKRLEKQMISKALEKTGGNRTKSSKLLEISHPSLLAKIKQYKI